MFKKYPYTGWLLAGLALWAFVGYRSYRYDRCTEPQSIAETVSKDLQTREHALQELLRHEGIFRRMYQGKLSNDEVRLLAKEPFYIYAFEDNVLIFWNNNTVVSTCDKDSLLRNNHTLFRNNGVYLKKCFHLPFLEADKSIVVLFPVSYNYPFENEYLKSHFAAADYIPPTTKVIELPDVNSFKVKDRGGKTLFYLQFSKKDVPRWTSDPVLIATILLALVVSVTWINLLAVALARRKRPLNGLLFIGGCILVFRGLTYWMGPPFHLGELVLFSRTLYSSSEILPTLGDLIINALCLLWLLVYTLSYFPSERLFIRPAGVVKNGIVSVAILALIVSCAFLPADIIRSLVIDSNISFDVSHFYTVNIYSVIGIFAIALVACCAVFFIYLLNTQYRTLVPVMWQRYSGLIIAATITILVTGKAVPEYELVAVGWLLLFIVLLDMPFLKKSLGLFAPNMIFWAVFISGCCTWALQHFNDVKEKVNRRVFADQVIDQRDNVMEYLFLDIAGRMSGDSILRAYFTNLRKTRSDIETHIGTAYLRGPFSRYDIRLYLFDRNKQALYNSDTTGFYQLSAIAEGAFPINQYLFHRENARDAHYYIAEVPVMTDSGIIEGYVFIDMALKKVANESVYPELLQPGKKKAERNPVEYSYGIYVSRRLVTQSNDYPFPAYLKDDTLHTGGVLSRATEEYSELWYKPDNEKVVVVLHRHKLWMEAITLFSYLLGMLIFFALVTLIFRLYFQYLLRDGRPEKLMQLTLRKRIHLAMLSVVFVSFLIIGGVTIWFFIDRYDESNKDKLQAAMQTLERSIQQYVKDHNADEDAIAFDAETDDPQSNFKNYINNLASSQRIDINVYNSQGELNTTSQDDIYNKLLLARIMMPDAYYRLSQPGSSLLIQNEQIGRLNYLSSYLPLRNEEGTTLGYINVPFFASQKELNFQISNILVALINLYAFIFLVSSLLAVFITNWLTRTLHLIISKFGQFTLQGQNQLLQWPYDDEIGLLISEYNKMVKKVEENAVLLAQSERESAWREMARQVAHEIKNPLTPMKLNIQHLQQALNSNHPNTKALTGTVAASLIEQIDNLSHIASAFSDFARMPEARPEEIDLNALLFKAAELYINNSEVTLDFEGWNEPLTVYADKSQLLRVFTNLLQNAVESIPEGRKGIIQVTVIKEGTDALISFSDNGSGISEETAVRIFSPYFTTKGSGTGLGLAMTKKIIEFSKGKIWFETKPGEGTTFFIRLPLK